MTGMTQKVISSSLGIPLRTWQEWETGRRTMPEYLFRFIQYQVRITTYKKKEGKYILDIIRDSEGHFIVVVNDIRFKGRQNIKWNEVESFLKEYVGAYYEIIDTADIVYIGPDFPGEFKGSEDTKRLKGANAKAKANAATQMPLLLKYADNKRWQQNYKIKHGADAEFGWYRFTSRFALPVYMDGGELIRYNIYRIEMLIRHASDGKMYLYDMVNVKKEKETSTPSEQ